MTFGTAISTCFSKFATFKGRASRSEYWYFYLFYVLVILGTTVVDVAIGIDVFANLAVLALFLPLLAVGARRLHDTNRSGWFILVPIYNLVLLCTAGTPGENRFGAPATSTQFVSGISPAQFGVPAASAMGAMAVSTQPGVGARSVDTEAIGEFVETFMDEDED